MPLGLLEELSRPALAGRYRRGRAILIGALLLLTGTASYLVVSKREDIWRSAHESTHGLALGLEASSSALMDQPLASLRGMRLDLERSTSPDMDVFAVLRNAARFDPASAYLGVIRGAPGRVAAIKADGSLVPTQALQMLSTALRPPATDAPAIQPLIQVPGSQEWYLPITAQLGGQDSRDFAFALVPAHRLAETADSLLTLKGGYLALASAEGDRLIRYHKDTGKLEVNGPRLLPATLELAARKPSGSAELYSPGANQSVVIGWARSRALPLYVSAAVPSPTLHAQWLREATIPMLAIALSLAGAAVFGWQLRGALRENQAYLEKLQYVADHDTLTGLLNRDAFSRSIQRSIEARPSEEFAVVLLDISGFNFRGRTNAAVTSPTAIFAARPTSEHPSHRSVSTVSPLARLLGLDIVQEYAVGQEQDVALHVSQREGVVLLAWSHTRIPSLLSYFPCDQAKVPKAWPSNRYDICWMLARLPGGDCKFQQVPQLLLDGDSRTCI